eukprot:11191447-Lingulodinium_polyedra.AAC.1
MQRLHSTSRQHAVRKTPAPPRAATAANGAEYLAPACLVGAIPHSWPRGRTQNTTSPRPNGRRTTRPREPTLT